MKKFDFAKAIVYDDKIVGYSLYKYRGWLGFLNWIGYFWKD